MTNRKALRSGAAAVAMAMALAGCSPGVIGQAERSVDAKMNDATKLVDKAQEPMPAADPGRVSISDDAYIPADAERSSHGLELPPQDGRISVLEPADTLPEIARLLTRVGHIPVSVAADMRPASGAAAGQAVTPGGVNQTISRLQVADVLGGDASGTNESGEIVPPRNTPTTMALRFNGPYVDLLDEIAAHFGGTWRYDGAQILISRNVTRTYTLHGLATNLTLTDTLTGSGINQGTSTSGGSSNSSQQVSSTISVKVWDDITNGISSIVGDQGKLATILTTGTITVTAPPAVVDAVQAFIDQQNKSLENEITVSVQVVTVTVSNSDNDSLDFGALVKSHGLAALIGNQASSATGASSSAAGTITPGVNIVTGGSKIALNLISKLGRVSTRDQATVTTMNGYVAPFQLTNTRNYVASTSVTSTPGGGANGGALLTTTLTPGTVTTGFNISILPRVEFADRSVLLNYGVSISSLAGANNGFDTFTSPDGSASVQLANVNSQGFNNNVEVPDGETVVLTGYSNDQATANKTGAGVPGFYGLSGSQSGTLSRQMTAILITPTVIRIKHSPIDTSAY